MLNFTVGPVMSTKEIREIGGEQIPYFRTPEFSKIMLDNEALLKEFFKADEDSRIVFLTASGTGAMDCAVQNTLNQNDNVLIVNGGSFGHRFVEICQNYEIPYTEIICEPGCNITAEQLDKIDGSKYTALLVNVDETSTGVLYDINLLSKFCKKYNLFFIVDSISSFLCDSFNMKELGVNLVLTGSQKALALAPGISLICIDQRAIERVNKAKHVSYYFDIKKYLVNGERGQTPFTPAVGILLQLNKRLHMIKDKGGVDAEVAEAAAKAKYFRDHIKDLPFEICSNSLSNAVTPLHPIREGVSAHKIFEIIKDEYGVYVCPNGGEFKDSIFRIGHIGDLSYDDYDKLIEIFKDLNKNHRI